MIQMCSYKVCTECGAILPRSKEFFFSHKYGKVRLYNIINFAIGYIFKILKEVKI